MTPPILTLSPADLRAIDRHYRRHDATGIGEAITRYLDAVRACLPLRDLAPRPDEDLTIRNAARGGVGVYLLAPHVDPRSATLIARAVLDLMHLEA